MNTFVNIFEFTKFRKFLAEYQERRQAAEPSFSRTEFCNLLGLPNTRSYLSWRVILLHHGTECKNK